VQCYRGEKNGFDLFWGRYDVNGSHFSCLRLEVPSPYREFGTYITPLTFSQDETLIHLAIHFAFFVSLGLATSLVRRVFGFLPIFFHYASGFSSATWVEMHRLTMPWRLRVAFLEPAIELSQGISRGNIHVVLFDRPMYRCHGFEELVVSVISFVVSVLSFVVSVISFSHFLLLCSHVRHL
jgi:hypothetical protein